MTEAVRLALEMLQPTKEERAAIDVAVQRTSRIWKECDTNNPVNRYRSPEGMPTADEVISALGVPWTRQVKLLDMVLVLTSAKEGRRLRGQQPKHRAGAVA